MQIAIIIALVGAASLFAIALNTGADRGAWRAKILVWLTLFGSMTSAVALLIVIHLLQATGDSVERQDRAYVLVKEALINYTEPYGPLARIELVNFGKTPAFELTGRGGCKVTNWPTSEKVNLADIEIDKDTIALGPAVDKTFRVKCSELQDVPSLSNGTSAIIVRGEYTYRDVFGKKRTGSFTRMVGGSYGINSNKMTELGSDTAD